MMRGGQRTKAELLEEIKNLRSRIAELEQLKHIKRNSEIFESDYTFQMIFQNAADGILVVDADSQKFYLANTRFCQMLGYSSEEIKSLSVADIHPEKDLPFVEEQLAKQVKRELSLAKDIPVKRSDGSVFYADVNSLPITLNGKKCLMGIFRDVTDRRKILEETHMLARFPSENLNPVLRIAGDGTVLYANEAGSSLLKYWKSRIGGKLPKDLCALVLESLKADKPRNHEITCGEAVYEFVFAPIRDSDCVNLYGLDITKHKKADIALKKSEETFRLAMEATNDSLWDWNMVTNEVYRNPRHATMLGYQPHELSASQQEWEKRIHPDDRENVFQVINQYYVNKKTDPFELEYRLKTKSGSYIWVLGRGKVVSYRDDGLPLRMVGTNIDITEHKKADQALKASEERYRSVVEDTPFLLCSFLPDGEIVFINAAYCEYFGKTSQELIGSNFKLLIPEDDRRAVLNNILSLTADSPIITHEHKVTAPDGQDHWQRWTNRGIFDEQGRVVLYQSFGEDVTDCKKAEQALKESEEHFRMLAEKMNDGLSQVDENGTIAYVNRRCAEMLGFTQEEMIGHHWMQFFGQDSRPIVAEQLQLRRKGIAEPYEVTNTRRDGQKLYIYFSPQPVFDRDNAFRGSFAIMTDITRIREMEEELFKEKNRLQSILEVMESGVTIRDLDYTLTYQNEFVTRLLGDHVGEKCYIAYEGINRICDGCSVELAYQDGKSHISERKMILPSGEVTYWENIANPMKDADGRIHACLEVSTNVTERKKVVEALRESEEKYRTLVEGAEEAIATINENGTFLFINKTGLKRLGVDDEDAAGKTMWDLFPKKYAQSQMEVVRQVIHTKQGMSLISMTQVRGQQRWYNTTIEPLKDAGGKVFAAMILARDITSFKQTQQKLDQYRDEMARAEQLASVGTLSATAAHELTQPLTVLRLLIEGALTRMASASSPDTVIEKLKDSLKEVSNITSVVDRLRSFARKSSRKISRELDLEAIASRIVRLLQDSAQRAGMTLCLEGMEKLPHIYSNDKDMEQLFFSLIDNALHAGQDRDNRRLIIGGAAKDRYIELRFCDNCGGICPEHLEKVFEPFFTTRADGQGTGLGLCIVKDVVSRAGGKVRLESQFGKGSTFIVTLPMNKR
jgi:PAS domain S-box-containing protein